MNRISPIDLQKCFEAGLGVTETAHQLGVTKGAVSKRAKALHLHFRDAFGRGGKTKELVLFHAGDIVSREINAVEQLHKINLYANELLDLIMRWMRGDDEALQVLGSQISKKKVRVGGRIEFITECKLKDPRELALRAMAEIREQIKLQFEMLSSLYDMENVAKFQEEVLTAIGEVMPDVRKQIIENLQRRRIIRSAIKRD